MAVPEELRADHRVPIGKYSAEKAEAILRGLVPGLVPLEIFTSSEAAELCYSLEGLRSFREAVVSVGVSELLVRLEKLAHASEETPALMSEAWEVFVEDRLFWDEARECWRFLLFFDTSAAWTALPAVSPDELWSALFTTAMDINPASEDALMQVVDYIGDAEFSVALLRRALGAVHDRLEKSSPEPGAPFRGADEMNAIQAGTPELKSLDAEIFGTEAFPAVPDGPGTNAAMVFGTVEEGPVPGEVAAGIRASGDAGLSEEDEEEFRPWENNERYSPAEIPLTGSTDEWILQNAAAARTAAEAGTDMPPGAGADDAEPDNPAGANVAEAGFVLVDSTGAESPGVEAPSFEEKQPERPTIAGIEPPPPPERGSVPRVYEDGVLVDDAMLRPQMPETSILNQTEGWPAAGGVAIGSIEPKKIPIPRVVRLSTKETANVDKPYFVIGCKPGSVDFLIQGNRVISRRHAAIITRDRDYFLTDLGSKNGVIVDGKRLRGDQEVQIFVGDSFILANERFKLQW